MKHGRDIGGGNAILIALVSRRVCGWLALFTVGVAIVVLACAGAARAASTGFVVTNYSNLPGPGFKLRFEEAKEALGWSIGFEGRPKDGSELPPGGDQRFDLKRSRYAAELRYRVSGVGRDLFVDYQISVSVLDGSSKCRFVESANGGGDVPFSERARINVGDHYLYCDAGNEKLAFDGFTDP